MFKFQPLTINLENCFSDIKKFLTTAGFAALKWSSWKRIKCDFTRFSRKIKINRNLLGILQNYTDPLYVFL